MARGKESPFLVPLGRERCGAKLAWGCLEERGNEQKTKKEIDTSNPEQIGTHPTLKVQNENGSDEDELFEDGRNHHRPEAHRIGADQAKCAMPNQDNAQKAKTRVGLLAVEFEDQ